MATSPEVTILTFSPTNSWHRIHKQKLAMMNISGSTIFTSLNCASALRWLLEGWLRSGGGWGLPSTSATRWTHKSSVFVPNCTTTALEWVWKMRRMSDQWLEGILMDWIPRTFGVDPYDSGENRKSKWGYLPSVPEDAGVCYSVAVPPDESRRDKIYAEVVSRQTVRPTRNRRRND